ncbi:MAG: hypothetical protein ACYS5W_06525 [Planctomycetota bacterium]
MHRTLNQTRCASSCALLLAVAWLAACKAPSAQPALQADASITVYPVLMAGTPSPDAAWAVGLLLERAGVMQIEIADNPFDPENISDPDEQAKAFASFVKKHPPTTDYALLGSYLGTPGKSVDEVRAVLADGSGAVVWRDRQGKQDAAFKKDTPRNPMTCSVFLVKRLCEPLHLQDPLRADAPRGKLEARYRARTGVPTPATFDAMKARQKQLRDAAPGATVVVYPVRVGGKLSKSDAEALVEMINAAGLFKAVLAETSVPFEVQQSVNQQRVLWSGAHSIQKQLRKNAPPADYALVADYLISGAGRPARGVHLFLCNRAGEFVVVDFQNSHHADYNRIKPRSSKDCTRLAVARLSRYLD